MKTIMYTIIILSLQGTDNKSHQRQYYAKEMSTEMLVTYTISDTIKVNIGDTVLFPMHLTHERYYALQHGHK